MANTLKFGNGNWATKEGSTLAYNDENGNFKPLPFDFSRASKATVINKDGLIEEVGSGEPRIDFKDDTKGALLLEPQRTNLLIHSNDFSQSEWNKQAIGTASLPVVTSNYGISPDGTQNADRVQLNLNGGTSGSDISFIGDYLTTISSATSGSFYLKSLDGIKNVRIRNGNAILNVDVTTQWSRFVVTDETSSNKLQVMLYGNSNSQSADLLIYGAQIEEGSYATSYIPTSGSAVTRLADACSQTPPDGVIGQTEGTMFCEISEESLQENSRYMSISVFNDPNKRITIYQSGGLINVYCSAGATFNFQYNPPDGRLKIAVGYKSGQYVLYVNGINAATSTESAVVACSDLGLGVNEYLGTANPPSVGYSQVVLYNTRLSNSELAALTQV